MVDEIKYLDKIYIPENRKGLDQHSFLEKQLQYSRYVN